MSKLIDSRLVGQTIKQLRLSRNWTQDHLADIVGYSVRNLRRIENDGTTSIDVVNTFANIFEISAIDILDGVSFLISLLASYSLVYHNNIREALCFWYLVFLHKIHQYLEILLPTELLCCIGESQLQQE